MVAICLAVSLVEVALDAGCGVGSASIGALFAALKLFLMPVQALVVLESAESSPGYSP